MFTKISLAIISLLFAAATADDSFLGLERILQAQGTVFTGVCTTDAGCATNLCCADYRRINGSATTNVTRTCINPLLNGRTVLFGGVNHTWSCLNQTVATTARGSACSANSACTSANTCCQTRSFGVWGVNQTVGTFCAL
jgi:hypothetical protein